MTPTVITKFYDRLLTAQRQSDSWLCIGLDPLHNPVNGGTDPASLLDFCRIVIDATADLVCTYKPNLAHWLRFGAPGIDALSALVQYIPTGIPVLLDAKFGDIAATANHYRQFAFETLGAQSVTLSPYVGSDAIRPFLSDPGRGVFVLARTSNLIGNEFQAVGQPRLYEQVVQQMVALAADYPGQIGLVVGATQPDELQLIRSRAPQLPFLIPGIGTQGGSLDAATAFGPTIDGIGPLINVGRAILYGQNSDHREVTTIVRERAQQHYDAIAQSRALIHD